MECIVDCQYRVVYDKGCLVVENPIVGLTDILIDTATHPELTNMGHSELGKYKERMLANANSLPFYYFCGLGFADPKDRDEFLVNIITVGKYVITKDGWMHPDWKAILEQKYSHKLKFS